MPEAAEQKLRAQARKKGFSGERFKAYVYGGLRRLGWKPKRERNLGRGIARAIKKRKKA